ncbi:hypothetical protein ACFYNF_36000 [Streptomyces sp. NPDC006641]|uniref:hypothetical protein n=1 Tax=Streptomyces sp. NPDC006641 TaxID=3364755 RepID=UPI0036ACF07C
MHTGERTAQQLLPPGHVAVVVVELALVPEEELRPRVAEVPRAVHAGSAADADVDEELAVEAGEVRQGQHPEVGPDEGAEAGLLVEDEAAHVGVQPVRADDEVEAARRSRTAPLRRARSR